VLHREGPLLILAGAGSGKTRVITYRIAYLIGDGHANPGEVLAVTFTNKAAQEMRDRVEALIGSASNTVWLSTFHSLCARLLRREAPKIGLSRDCVIYDSSDQLAVVKQAERELGIDDKFVPPRAALSRISQAKNRMEGPESLRASWNIRDEQIARIYERYLIALKDAVALDFDDLLLRTVELFDTSEQVRDFYRSATIPGWASTFETETQKSAGRLFTRFLTDRGRNRFYAITVEERQASGDVSVLLRRGLAK